MGKLKKILPLILIVPLFFVMAPLFHDGFFPTMDDIQVVRIEEMFKELSSGQFPARVAMDLGNGAGYMLFEFYSPFIYYLGAFFHLVGATLVISTKLTFISGFIIGCIGIYFLLKEEFDKISSIFGSILFFASSYSGYDAFHRGDLAEFFAMCLLPWPFHFLLKFSKTNQPIYSLAGSGSVALIIITHNLTAFMVAPFLGIFTLLLFRHKLLEGLTLLFGGVLISTFYWLPVLAEKQYIIVDKVDFLTQSYKSNLLQVPQLLGFAKIPWGFVPPILGPSVFVGSSIGLIFLLKKKQFSKDQNQQLLVIFSIASFFLTLFLSSNLSFIIWSKLNAFIGIIQFPWRFLTLATLFGSICSAFFLSRIKNLPLKLLVGIALILPLFTLQLKYLRPLSYNYISKYTADDPCGTAGWSNEYQTIWTDVCLPKGAQLNPVNTQSGNLAFSNVEIKDHGRNYQFNSSGSGGVYLDKYYFPGWVVAIDNLPQKITPLAPYGLISFSIPDGDHSIAVGFKDTPVRMIANYISLLTGLILLFFLYKPVTKHKIAPK